MRVEIHLTGPDASVLAELASSMLEGASGGIKPQYSSQEPNEEASKDDLVAIAALIISIPSAIVAAMDLIQRTELVDRVHALLKKLRKSDATAKLVAGSETPLDLTSATADQVLDRFAR